MPELKADYIRKESSLHVEAVARIKANLQHYSESTRDLNNKQAQLTTISQQLNKLTQEIKAVDDENNDQETLTILKNNLQTQIAKFLKAKQSELQVEHIQEAISRLRDDLQSKTDAQHAEAKALCQELISLDGSINSESRPEIKVQTISADPLTGRSISMEIVAPEESEPVDALKQFQQQYKNKLCNLLEKNRPNIGLEERRILIVQNYLKSLMFRWIKTHSKDENAICDELKKILENIKKNNNDEQQFQRYFPGKLRSQYILGEDTLEKLSVFIKLIYPREPYTKLKSFLSAYNDFYAQISKLSSVFDRWDSRQLKKYLPNGDYFLHLDQSDENFVDPLNANSKNPPAASFQIFPNSNKVLQPELLEDFAKMVEVLKRASVIEKSIELPEPDLIVRSSASKVKPKTDTEKLIDNLCENPMSDINERKAWINANRDSLYISSITWAAVLEFINIVFGAHDEVTVTNQKIVEAQEKTTVLDFMRKLHSYVKEVTEATVNHSSSSHPKQSMIQKIFNPFILTQHVRKLSIEKNVEEKPAYHELPLIKQQMTKIINVLALPPQLERLVSDPTGEAMEQHNKNKSQRDILTAQKTALEENIITLQKSSITHIDEPLIKLLRTHALHAFQQTLYPAKAYTEPKIISTIYNNIMHWFHHSPGWFTNTGGQKPIFKFVRDLFDPDLKDFSVAADMITTFLQRHKTKESGLHTDSFDIFFLQLLYNSGTPKGLFKLHLTTTDIKDIKDLPDLPALPAGDAELRRFMLTPLPEVNFAGSHQYHLRGINCQSTRNRSIIRTQAINNFCSLKGMIEKSPLPLFAHYDLGLLSNSPAVKNAETSVENENISISVRM